MAKMMKAWMTYDFNDMRLEEVPVPEVKPGWVLVKVKVVQPSITEVTLFRGAPSRGKAAFKRQLEEKKPLRRFGHEFTAEVVEVGEGVRRVKVGDRVAMRTGPPCHNCELCLSGRSNECHKGPRGSSCLAEYALLVDDTLARLTDNIDDNEGALLQPLGSCAQAHEWTEVGDTAVVYGQGTMGMFNMQLARVSGAGIVIAVDIRDEALELSKKLGADITINATKDDPVQKVMEITRGIGADVVYEAAGGSPQLGLAGSKTLNQAIDTVRYGGRVVVISIYGEPCPVDLGKLRTKAIRLNFPMGATLKSLDHVIQLVSSGRIKIKPMISHTVHGLEKTPEAFEITANKTKYGATGPCQIVV